MKYPMKLTQNEAANLAAISFLPADRFIIECPTGVAAERFLRTASLCKSGEYLGLELAGDGADGCRLLAFSSPGVAASAEDFGWIFERCGTAAVSAGATLTRFDEVYEKIYRLEERPGAETAEARHGESGSFRRLLDAMLSSKASLRILAGGEGMATVLLGMSDPMPLRMRAMLSIAFPGTKAVEWTGPDDPDRLSEACLTAGLTGLFEALMEAQSSIPEPPELLAEDEEEDDTDDFEDVLPEVGPSDSEQTPLGVLRLSVRTRVFLKRAGCNTVEQLAAMTDEDLRRHDMPERCIMEIRQKLPETETQNVPAPSEGQSWFGMLDDLIGLQPVKEQIRKIAAYARMKRDLEARNVAMEPIVLNMSFVGNPGTAKTTVARILAGIFHEIGLLSDTVLVEVGRADLIARFEGQTAEKVRSVFQKARGRLLFIDEAYSLLEEHEGEFGDEAISTIVQEMENRRADTVVIFAGYPGKMDDLMARNPGLRSRIPFHIRFADYSVDEMVQIALREANKRGFSLSEGAQERASVLLKQGGREPDSGNGRLCRNLIETSILNYAARVYGGDDGTKGDFVLLEQDISLPELRSRRADARIGF